MSGGTAGGGRRGRAGRPFDPRWIEQTAVSVPAVPLPGAAPTPPPVEGFLEVLRVALGAARVAVWRRDGEAWLPEREARDGRAEPAGGKPFAEAGHPFSWALKEGLQLQVPTGELFGAGGGWSLLGGPAGSGRVLCISFDGSPPAAARPVLGPALRHLRALHRAESGRGAAVRPVGGDSD